MQNDLIQYARNNFNVLLIGPHGVGKTTVMKEVFKLLDKKFAYLSAPTLNPWIQLVGVPVPNKETHTLDMYRLKMLEEAEFIFFDELNRAPLNVLNAIYEIIQFKTINGHPLPNLKAAWGAINPPGGQYDVEDLDPALVDRFHVYINMTAHINRQYMEQFGSLELVSKVADWWEQNLSQEQKHPRLQANLRFLAKSHIGLEGDLA
jgi:MoxR-like ATPase